MSAAGRSLGSGVCAAVQSLLWAVTVLQTHQGLPGTQSSWRALLLSSTMQRGVGSAMACSPHADCALGQPWPWQGGHRPPLGFCLGLLFFCQCRGTISYLCIQSSITLHTFWVLACFFPTSPQTCVAVVWHQPKNMVVAWGQMGMRQELHPKVGSGPSLTLLLESLKICLSF